MTNLELLLKINDKTRGNIEQLNSLGRIEELNKCIAFSDDLRTWLSYCDNFSEYLLVKEAQTECVNSIFMCAQGFYKEAISILRQYLEHVLFSILLSTNDYKYRLWQVGQYDMSWTQLMDGQNGIFGVQFMRMYAKDIDEDRSLELLTIAKAVYRECSEFVHGNFEKLSVLFNDLSYNEQAFDCYVKYFASAQYVVCMALFIRFREILNNSETLKQLESILTDNLGTLVEVQLLLSKEGESYNE